MCDYSLAELPNRLAVEGEELITHRFRTGSIGLTSSVELCALETELAGQSFWRRLVSFFEDPAKAAQVPAVCVPPGASLALTNVPAAFQRQWCIEEEAPVTFLQTSAAVNTYRDAILLRYGHEILLQNLPEGLRMRVLSLGGADQEGEREHNLNWFPMAR